MQWQKRKYAAHTREKTEEYAFERDKIFIDELLHVCCFYSVLIRTIYSGILDLSEIINCSFIEY